LLLSRYDKFILFVLEQDAYGTIVFVLALAFTVISNVLLLNVLIAMFKWVYNIDNYQIFKWSCFAKHSEKIQRVQEKSNELWRYQRFGLVNEFEEKTVLPPPMNVLCYLVELVKYLICCCKRRRTPVQNNQNSAKIMNNLGNRKLIFLFKRNYCNVIPRLVPPLARH
jgi:hypothetical protein